MARVNLNQKEISRVVQVKTLPLVFRTGIEIFQGARRLAPQGDHLSGSGAAKSGPTLQQALSYKISTRPSEIRMRIGAKTDYAMTVHQGSQAHVIRGHGKMLKFRWERGDFLVAARSGRRRGNRRTRRFHYFVSVRHPGNKRPVQYLVTPLHMFGRLNGFQTYALLRGAGPLP